MKIFERFLKSMRNYFGFTQTEFRAMLILMPFTIIIIILLPLYRAQFSPSSVMQVLDSLNKVEAMRELANLAPSTDSSYNHVSKETFSIKKQKFTTGKEKLIVRTTQIEPFDLNKADSSILQRIRGVGPVLSNRIIRFRDALGGYISQEQLYLVYHLDSSVVDIIKKSSYISEGFQPEKLNLKDMDSYEISKHPYIDRKQAELMKNYHTQHPNMKDPFDFTKLPAIDSAFLNRIMPYLSFGQH